MQIPRLHPDTIEQVKDKADIVDVISEYVVLRKRGKDFIGLCPFHSEKSPSFSVNPTKQVYFCFGCQAAGNVFKFVMDVEKRQFSEVVLELAQRYQVPVKTLEPEQRQELQRQISIREQLYEVLAGAAKFYQHALKQPQSKHALDYLQEKRKLNGEIIQQFDLGYAPPGWETLYRYLVVNRHYPVQLVEKAGLIKPRKEGNGYYDVFRDRLMIPIHDAQGRVIAFGGRTLGDEQPKYLNSPETEVFYKGKTLFALDKARNAISVQDQVVVVEGYFDAIALHAAGITNVVASLGTALSLDQVKLVLRYTDEKEIVLNFDADKAGTNAADRAIGEIANLAYQGEVKLKILNIPDGKDADEYLHTHKSEDYQELLQKAPLWLNWQIEQIIRDKDLKQATDFQQVSQQFVKLLKNLVNPNTCDYYITYCAEILSLGNSSIIPLRIENLRTQIAPAIAANIKPVIPKKEQSSPSPVPNKGDLLEAAEALLLIVYLHYPQHRQLIIDSLEERDLQFSLSHHRFLWQKVLEIPEDIEEDLISTVQDKCLYFTEEMRAVSHVFHLNEKTQHEMLYRHNKLIQVAAATMEKMKCEMLYRHFMELWKTTNPETEPELHNQYYAAFIKYNKRFQELERERLFSITDFM